MTTLYVIHHDGKPYTGSTRSAKTYDDATFAGGIMKREITNRVKTAAWNHCVYERSQNPALWDELKAKEAARWRVVSYVSVADEGGDK